MTTTNITSAAAHVQGLQAFMAMEEKAAATDTALEAAATQAGPGFSVTTVRSSGGICC